MLSLLWVTYIQGGDGEGDDHPEAFEAALLKAAKVTWGFKELTRDLRGLPTVQRGWTTGRFKGAETRGRI